MKKLPFYLMMIVGLSSISVKVFSQDELDRVFIYQNQKLAGTWRANENQVVHIDKIADGDTLTFRARTDLGGLGNSSIDIKDDNGVFIENIESPTSSDEAGTFRYIFNIKKIDTAKVSSLQAFLNLDPDRHLAPPTIATISLLKK